MGFFSSIIKPVLGAGIGLMTGGLGGAAVGAGLGLLGNSSDSKQQAAYNQQMDFAQQQFDFQKDYVKSALQWRVEDAKKAGVHPMAALGMSSPSFSPVSTPSYTPSDSFDPMELGQSINYAATKAKSRQQQAQMVNLQMRGLELDNEYKQALIDNMKVDTLAASIASNQAFESPAAPTVNAKEPVDDVSIDSSISRGTKPLLGASRVGNSVMLHINPEISDSITEDLARNMAANIAAEAQMGRISPEVLAHFSKREREAVARGDAVIEYSPPSQFFFRWAPHMRSRKNRDGSISGRILPW